MMIRRAVVADDFRIGLRLLDRAAAAARGVACFCTGSIFMVEMLVCFLGCVMGCSGGARCHVNSGARKVLALKNENMMPMCENDCADEDGDGERDYSSMLECI